MPEMTCQFCQAMEDRKQIRDFWRSKGDKETCYEFNVALVIRMWKKARGKSTASRTTDYCYRGIGYKLNFCPECGRDLRRRSK